eukprot:12419338-Ditylum_brightwellii.AAC.1
MKNGWGGGAAELDSANNGIFLKEKEELQSDIPNYDFLVALYLFLSQSKKKVKFMVSAAVSAATSRATAGTVASSTAAHLNVSKIAYNVQAAFAL